MESFSDRNLDVTRRVGKIISIFLSLEKRNKTKSHITKLIGISGKEITDQKLALEEIKSFYTNLHTSKSRKTERECLQYMYIASINTSKLSETNKLKCEENSNYRTAGMLSVQ